MGTLEIKEVSFENIDDFINLCIPSERKEDPFFIQGRELKKQSTIEAIKKMEPLVKLPI